MLCMTLVCGLRTGVYGWTQTHLYTVIGRTNEFKECLPETSWITYVGRGKGSQTWPECGFYGMNLNHPVCHEFLKEFERVYEDADNGIFLLEEWHDSFVFGNILNNMKRDFPNALDYSADMYLREAKTGGGGHPSN